MRLRLIYAALVGLALHGYYLSGEVAKAREQAGAAEWRAEALEKKIEEVDQQCADGDELDELKSRVDDLEN